MLISSNESKKVQLSQDWFGSLSNHVDNGRENAIKKTEFALFQTRFYLASLNFLTMGDFRWSRVLMDSIQVQKEKEKIIVVCLLPS